MKTYFLAASLFFAATTAFSQSSTPSEPAEKAKEPALMNMAAISDTSLANKKGIADDNKKKKARREKNHKECSRMKS